MNSTHPEHLCFSYLNTLSIEYAFNRLLLHQHVLYHLNKFENIFKNYGKVALLGEEQRGVAGESARKREGKGRR